MRVTSRQSGFTLVEVLVAFVVAALSITIVFQMIGRGANSIALAQDYHHATLIAESILNDPTDQSPSGELDRFSWQKTAARAIGVDEAERGGSPAARDVTLEDVDITVRWHRQGRDHEFSLRTQRLASTSDTAKP